MTDYKQQTQEFLDNIKKSSGVSDRFLEQSRPSLEKLFRDVSGPALENTLADLTDIYKSQAEAEKVCAQAKEDAKKLEKVELQLQEDLKKIKKNVTEMRDTLRGTMFSLSGVRGEA